MPRIPSITSTQMAKVDDLMMNYYGITILQMMEHDGVALTLLSKKILKGLKNKKIVVVFGSGGNGGGALATARLLHVAGAQVKLVTSAKAISGRSATGKQLEMCKKIGLRVFKPTFKLFNNTQLIIDGMLGYSIQGAPRGKVLSIIELINRSNAAVLANDLPSGLDPDTGEIYEPTVNATYTMTIALPKKGVVKKSAKKVVGSLYLADIGVPPELYKKLRIKVGDIFRGEVFIKL